MALPTRRSDRRDPLRGFGELYQEMDRFMRTAVDGGDPPAWSPAADVAETEDAYVVDIELPGVRRKDVDVELRGDELVVTGELKERERKGLLRRSTRRVGAFEYRVALPGALREEGVEATLANGVLTVRVPKAEHTRATKITITER